MTLEQAFLAYHMTDPFPEWDRMLAYAAAEGQPFRVIKSFHPEDYAPTLAASPLTDFVYRPYVDKLNQGHWLDMAGDGRADQAADEFIDTWIDSVVQHQPGGWVESVNEEYPTGNRPKLRRAVAFDAAFIRRMRARLPGRGAIVFTAAVGNPGWDELDELDPLLSEMVTLSPRVALGYHAYWPVQDGLSRVDDPVAWTHLHGRFAGIDDWLVGQGLYFKWFLGEVGPIGCDYLDPPPGGNWNLRPLDGWHHPEVWNGNVQRYIADLGAFNRLLAGTRAARQGRLLGATIFNSSPNAGKWTYFNTIGTAAWGVADIARAGVVVGNGTPPPPEPEPDLLRYHLWEASVIEQIALGLQLNPEAALQRAILAAGQIPVHNERKLAIDGQEYTIQAGESLDGSTPRRLYVWQPGKAVWSFETP